MILNSRYRRYQLVIDELVKSISTLYLCSCRPLVVMKADGSFERTDIDTWLSEDAKKSYEQMQRNLKSLLEEQAEAMKKENK